VRERSILQGVEIKGGKIHCKGKKSFVYVLLDKLFNSTKAKIVLYVENRGDSVAHITITPHYDRMGKLTSWCRSSIRLEPKTEYGIVLEYPCDYEVKLETLAGALKTEEFSPEFSMLRLSGGNMLGTCDIVVYNITVVIEE